MSWALVRERGADLVARVVRRAVVDDDDLDIFDSMGLTRGERICYNLRTYNAKLVVSMRNLTSRQIATLHQFGDAPFSLAAIQPLFPDKKSYRVAASLVQAGILLRLKRDLFVLSEQILGHPIDRYVVANRLCAPSYVSREAALSYAGLIPEHVVNMTCSRLGRPVEFETPIGGFQYAAVDSAVYAVGLCEMASGENRFLCATPEKALYDLVIVRSHLNIRSRVEMRRFLFEDLRLSTEDHVFDEAVFDELLANGRKKRMVQLMKEVLCHGSV